MDAEADDFNSSDIELPKPPPNPYASLGHESIQSMREHATEDRVKSKIASKMLEQIDGALGTILARNAWLNRFQAFREHTLKQPSVILNESLVRLISWD